MPTSNTTLSKTLLDLEQQFWQAIKDGDGDTVMRLTDDTCVVNRSNSGSRPICTASRRARGHSTRPARR